MVNQKKLATVQFLINIGTLLGAAYLTTGRTSQIETATSGYGVPNTALNKQSRAAAAALASLTKRITYIALQTGVVLCVSTAAKN